MDNKNKKKSRKILLTLLLLLFVSASGLTGYAVMTGNMPPFFNSSSIEDKTLGKSGLKPESVPDIIPDGISPTDTISQNTVSSESAAVDPDEKVTEDTFSRYIEIKPEPIAVVPSQNDTASKPSQPVPDEPSDSSTAPDDPVSSIPNPPVSSEPEPSTPNSKPSSDHHHRPSTPTINISGITLDKTELEMNKGDISPALIATITPSNAAGDKTVTWSTCNDTVATVDKEGRITAVGAGTTRILAHTSNGKTATCTVTVLVPASGIRINSDDFSLDKGTSKTLTATVEPEDCTDKSVTWATSNNDIVSVDQDGIITAEKAGTATITATTADGKISSNCNVNVVVSISNLKLDKTESTMVKGTEDTLTATIDPPDATEEKTVLWTSSDPSVAKVDETGKVTALARGTATITAQVGSHVAECNITVIVPVSGIALNKESTTIIKGKDETLIASIFPDDSNEKSVEWTSSDESIATVDEHGKVTAMNAGTAVITAKTHDGEFTADCSVTVVIPVTGITLNEHELDLIKGNSYSLIATITPTDATDQEVTWISSNTDVATVDETGKVTAINGGTTTIRVITHDGNFAGECMISVSVPVSGITLSKDTLRLTKGANKTLIAAIHPDDANNKNVLWATSNENICKVDVDGKVTAVNAGTAVITATSEDGGYTAQCSVTVVIPVTGVTLDKTSLSLIRGNSATLAAIITPNDATDKSVIWTSSNPDIATVDSNGKITAIGVGTADIQVTAHDGGFTSTCFVSVTPDTYTITANAVNGHVNGAGTYHVGNTVTLTAIPDAHYHFTGWSDGVMTASRAITVTQDMNLTANFEIDTYSVEITSGFGGTVTGGGNFTYGSSITITAVPNYNFHFINWSDGNTDTKRVLTVTGNINLTSIFKPDGTDEDLFKINDYGNGTCSVIGFDANANISTVKIPAFINGKKVVAMDSHEYVYINHSGGFDSKHTVNVGVFFENQFVKTVILPNTMTRIGGSSFGGCGERNCLVTSVIIPDSVTTIDGWAFNACNIKTIDIPNSVTFVGELAFNWWDSSQTIRIFGKNQEEADCAWGIKWRQKLDFDFSNGVEEVFLPIDAHIIYFKDFY